MAEGFSHFRGESDNYSVVQDPEGHTFWWVVPIDRAGPLLGELDPRGERTPPAFTAISCHHITSPGAKSALAGSDETFMSRPTRPALACLRCRFRFRDRADNPDDKMGSPEIVPWLATDAQSHAQRPCEMVYGAPCTV
jgi:hypothetical protein